MKHGELTAARLHEEDLQKSKSRYRRAMVTLTYRNIDDWRADDVSYFMRLVRQWCKRREIEVRYVWVAELQKRGAVHYHVVFDWYHVAKARQARLVAAWHDTH